MDYLLGVDLGSTSLKAVAYDTSGNVVASGSRPTERFHPEPAHPEWTVWQPEQIWEGTAAAIRDAVAALDDPGNIRALAVVGMGMDGLPVDDRGQWLYPFISWLDPRTAPQFEWWKRNITVEKGFSIGGNPLWPINSALRMLWMRENEPQVFARADKWLLIEDFLNFMLCGRQATDYSMASCTALFDQRTLTWSDELLRLSSIERRLLCDAFPSGTLLGEITPAAAKQTGLAPGTPVVLGGHDHLAGALPVGAFRPGVVLDVTGTWESVLTATPAPALNPAFPKMGVTVQAHVARGRHSAWGGVVASEMLEWHRKQYSAAFTLGADVSPQNVWERLIAAAASAPPGAHGVMFLPHMSGAACPVVDSRSLGAFVGLSGMSTAADMLRAILEGLNYQLLDIVTAMQSAIAEPLERFVAVGGATRNAFWMQNKADMLGRPLEVPAVTEATPLGAAIMAGIGVGLYADEEDAFARVYKPGKTYQPDRELSARYARWFPLYQELYGSLAGVHHRLFDEFVGGA